MRDLATRSSQHTEPQRSPRASMARLSATALMGGALLCVLVTALPAFAAKPPKRGQTAEDAFREGVGQLGAGQTTEAVRSFRRCVELKPDLKECWYNLGLAYGRKRAFAQEANAYAEAVKLDPNYAKAQFNLGVVLEDLGKAAAALKHYERAIAADPEAQDARLNRAMLLLRQGKVDAAVVAFEAAIKLKPNNPEAWFDLAQAQEIKADKLQEPARTQGLRAAIRTYYQCIHHAPKHHRAWYNIGVVHHRLKDFGSEIAAYQKAVLLKKNYTPARYNLAFALRDKGDKVKAKIAFEQYLKIARGNKGEKRFVAAADAELAKL